MTTTLLLFVVAAAAAQNVSVISSQSTIPPTIVPKMRFMTAPPKLDRAHKNKLLVEAPCGQQCHTVLWEIKVAGERTWRKADAEAHSNFPDTFYVRSLRPDTLYVLRGLLRESNGVAYEADDVPTLEARTCPESPPPVSNVHVHSAGPGWLEVRWTPPPKEQCKSHLFYQARYAPYGTYFSPWRQYGFYRTDRWVHFRPTHPCAVWPAEFCMLVTDGIKAGEQHVVEVRVSRFDELTPALSESRKVTVRADTGCVANDSCGVIGAAPASASTASAASDDVDLDAADLTTTPLPPAPSAAPSTLTPAVTQAPGGGGGECVSAGAASATRDSVFGYLSPLFLALMLITCAVVPAAFIWGKRRGALEVCRALEVSQRRLDGDGGSQQVLLEAAGGDEQQEPDLSPGTALHVDQHGRYSWAKLVSHEE